MPPALFLFLKTSSSVTPFCPTLCDPLDYSMPGFHPLPPPRVCSNSCPLSRWCHPTISSSVVPFSSCFQSFPASGSSPMNQFFTSEGQNIGVSASALVLPMNIQDPSPLGWTGCTSLPSKGLSRVFSDTTGTSHQTGESASVSCRPPPKRTALHPHSGQAGGTSPGAGLPFSVPTPLSPAHTPSSLAFERP